MNLLWAFTVYLVIGVGVASWFYSELKRAMQTPESELGREEEFYQRETRIYIDAIGGWRRLFLLFVFAWPLICFRLLENNRT